MTDRQIRVTPTDELARGRLEGITELCVAAFGEPPEALWEGIGPGLHVIAEVGARPVAHAMVVDRTLYIGDDAVVSIDAGYVELVATRPELQSHGHATAVMRTVGTLIAEEYVLGALATGSNSFYERLGWETWSGPTAVRMPDGERVRSAAEDGHVMILRTSRTPSSLAVTMPISVDWRPGDPW